MTGKLEPTNTTGASPPTHGLQADDIITPEELASMLKVPESWVYEKTRRRCRNPIPCLRLGKYIRFDFRAVAAWLAAPAPQDTRPARPALPNRPKPAPLSR
jgi:excisionase family DNA binding protein